MSPEPEATPFLTLGDLRGDPHPIWFDEILWAPPFSRHLNLQTPESVPAHRLTMKAEGTTLTIQCDAPETQQEGWSPAKAVELIRQSLRDRTDNSLETTPHPDGPDGRLQFWWRGRVINLKKASKRRRLLLVLWDSTTSRPREAVEVTEVLDAIWPDDDRAEGRLPNLIHETNEVFRLAGMALSIHQGCGRVWLEDEMR